jgi:hypothetical protein
MTKEPNHSDWSDARLLGVWKVSGDATDEDLDALAKLIGERMLVSASMAGRKMSPSAIPPAPKPYRLG